MNIVTIGKLLVPVEQIAFVETFDPASNPEFKPEKPFKGRVVLLNRDTVLTELAPQEFAEANGFHLFAEDNVAVNPLVAFRVETFTATETFKPSKAYLTRLKWFDPGRNERSRLLVTAPEDGDRRALPARCQSVGGFEARAAPIGAYQTGSAQC